MAFNEWLLGRARVSSRPHRAARLDDLLTLFQQLSTLISSGTPLLQALRISAEENQSLRLRQVLQEIASRVASGSPVHAAAAAHPRIFEAHWVEVIRTGELTGQMGPVLQELTRQVRDSREVRRKIAAALVYPVILAFVAVAALTIMLWFVVPTFAAMFKDMGTSLPGPTQFVIDASGLIVDYGLVLGSAAAIALALFRRYARSESGRMRLGSLGLATPIVGEFLVQTAMYRFASNLALLLKSGVPMLQALETLAGVFQANPVYREALGHAQINVASGRPLALALEETGLFTSMVTNMVRIGEESGQLAGMMEQLAPYYKEKTETLVMKITKLLEPAIIIGMGAAIAAVMVAIYLPMFEMAGKIH
jgi:type IV pilus assembly protein PilC